MGAPGAQSKNIPTSRPSAPKAEGYAAIAGRGATNKSSTVNTSTHDLNLSRNFQKNALISSPSPFAAPLGLPLHAAPKSIEKRIPGSVGLANIGNSCYLNCIIQCLANAAPLTNYILGDGDGGGKNNSNDNFCDDLQIGKGNPLGSGGQVAQSYASLLQQIWQLNENENNNTSTTNDDENDDDDEKTTQNETNKINPSVASRIIVPQQFKQTIAAFAPQFSNRHQHDAQELASFVLDGLHEDLNRTIIRNQIRSTNTNTNTSTGGKTITTANTNGVIHAMDDPSLAIKTWQHHLLKNDSIIADRFQGMHRTCLTCPNVNCRKQSTKFDVFSSLSLTLSSNENNEDERNRKYGHHNNSNSYDYYYDYHSNHSRKQPDISLESCLSHFAREERLDDGNAWYCSNCKAHVNAIKSVQLWSVPDVLIVHLKRFTYEYEPVPTGGGNPNAWGVPPTAPNMKSTIGNSATISGSGSGSASAATNYMNTSTNANAYANIVKSKIKHPIEYPIQNLDMAPYMHKASPIQYDPKAPPTYTLFGVAEHEGETADSGHYTAIVKNSKSGTFYRCNDSTVEEVNMDADSNGIVNVKTNANSSANLGTSLNKSGAYLLFYQREKGEARWGGMARSINMEDERRRKGGTGGGIGRYSKPVETDDDGFAMVVTKKKKKKRVIHIR